jgi:hypothetical protein
MPGGLEETMALKQLHSDVSVCSSDLTLQPPLATLKPDVQHMKNCEDCLKQLICAKCQSSTSRTTASNTDSKM